MLIAKFLPLDESIFINLFHYSRRKNDDQCLSKQWLIDHNLYDNVRRARESDFGAPFSLFAPVFTMYDKLRLSAKSEKMRVGIACYTDRSFLSSCPNFAILPAPSLSSLQIVKRDDVFWFSRGNPASNFDERGSPFPVRERLGISARSQTNLVHC